MPAPTSLTLPTPSPYHPTQWLHRPNPWGKKLAAAVHKNEGQQPAVKVALFEIGSPDHVQFLDAQRCSCRVQFTPDGKAVAYTVSEYGVENIWIQPLDGSTGLSDHGFQVGENLVFSVLAGRN